MWLGFRTSYIFYPILSIDFMCAFCSAPSVFDLVLHVELLICHYPTPNCILFNHSRLLRARSFQDSTSALPCPSHSTPSISPILYPTHIHTITSQPPHHLALFHSRFIHLIEISAFLPLQPSHCLYLSKSFQQRTPDLSIETEASTSILSMSLA